ncbi:Methionine--tRNA ligase [bioreactor metagenome]|uniref:Methionine--tRNA ligase n=1 Tax=bioreactor metagenome TaxID=1076179 RepID=A0A645AHA4_9ZZZZ
MESGNKVTDKPAILFARIDDKEMMAKIENDQHKEAVTVNKKPMISIEDFAKIQLRVGTVIASKKHPKADKLLVSQIDIGSEVRQIVSGIAEFITPEAFVGQQVIVVANLHPAVIRGIESQGMILAGEENKLLEVVKINTLPNGTEIS